MRWQTARLGTIGKIGAGLLMLGLVFFLTAVLSEKSTLYDLKMRAGTLQSQLSSASRRTSDGDESDAPIIGDDQALQIFYDFFPRTDSSPFWIRELVRVAKEEKVEINSSEYRLVQEQGERLTRYEMVLPIRGRYSQIRAFVAAALQAVPAMAIADLTIKRDNVQTEQLEVRLEISLYLDD
jgi:hypothetical protein